MLGEPDQEKWLQDKILGKNIVSIKVDEFGQIIITVHDGTTIAFAVDEQQGGGWVDAYEV